MAPALLARGRDAADALERLPVHSADTVSALCGLLFWLGTFATARLNIADVGGALAHAGMMRWDARQHYSFRAQLYSEDSEPIATLTCYLLLRPDSRDEIIMAILEAAHSSWQFADDDSTPLFLYELAHLVWR